MTHVKVGDRVLAMAAGSAKQRNRASESRSKPIRSFGAADEVIPDDLSYVEAAVVPLGLTTAACGLFQRDLLALEFPSAASKARGQWVIICGGATSVGSNAVQLAVAAGYNVVATASPRNFEYVRSLGAGPRLRLQEHGTRTRDVVEALHGKGSHGCPGHRRRVDRGTVL